MACIEHDRATRLLAAQTGTSVRLLDRDDLAVLGAVLISLAAAERALTPNSAWAALNYPEPPADQRVRTPGPPGRNSSDPRRTKYHATQFSRPNARTGCKTTTKCLRAERTTRQDQTTGFAAMSAFDLGFFLA